MQHLRELDRDYKLVSTAYDPRFFDVAAKMLSDEGLTMEEVPQESGKMTAAVGYLYAEIMARNVTHDDDEGFTRQVLNAVPRYSERGFVLAKSKSHGKIDAATAMSLAFDQVLRFEETAPSVYEDRELAAV
jgi:phage terminase large subunit-like protein